MPVSGSRLARRLALVLAIAAAISVYLTWTHLTAAFPVAVPSPPSVLTPPSFGRQSPAQQPSGQLANSQNATDDLDGYGWISYFRGLAGLDPVARDAGIESQESTHVRYLADHSLSCETDVHDELITASGGCGPNRYATPAGKAAASNSDIVRDSAPLSDEQAVTSWFASAFHALPLLDPRLQSTGYAAYYTADPTGAAGIAYKFTAAVDVYRGRTGNYPPRAVAFPATGAVSPLLSYRVGTETPEPFRSSLPTAACHSWGARVAVSAPIIVQWPLRSQGRQDGARIVDLSTGAVLPTCALGAAQYPAGSVARQLLLGTDRETQAALYYAADPFQAGDRYQLTVGQTVLTTFTASDLPSVPTVISQPRPAAIVLAWSMPTPGSGSLAGYRLTEFTDATCTRTARTLAASGTASTITVYGLTTGKRYFLRLSVLNSLGAVRSTSCLAARAG